MDTLKLSVSGYVDSVLKGFVVEKSRNGEKNLATEIGRPYKDAFLSGPLLNPSNQLCEIPGRSSQEHYLGNFQVNLEVEFPPNVRLFIFAAVSFDRVSVRATPQLSICNRVSILSVAENQLRKSSLLFINTGAFRVKVARKRRWK